ncbi:hypothetical protein IW146_008436, partial [Coemansia sp. RSA 922]
MCIFDKIALVLGFGRKRHHDNDNDNDVLFKRRRQTMTPGAPSAPASEPPSAPASEPPSMVANECNSGGIQNADTAAPPSPARSAMSSKVPRAPGTARPKNRVRFQLSPLQTPKPERHIPLPEWSIRFLGRYSPYAQSRFRVIRRRHTEAHARYDAYWGYGDIKNPDGTLRASAAQKRSIDAEPDSTASRFLKRYCEAWNRVMAERAANIEAALNIKWRRSDVKELRRLDSLDADEVDALHHDRPTAVSVVNVNCAGSTDKGEIIARRVSPPDLEYGHMQKKRAVCGGDTNSLIIICELDRSSTDESAGDDQPIEQHSGAEQLATPNAGAATESHVVAQVGTSGDRQQSNALGENGSQTVALDTDGEQPTGSSANVIGNHRRASPDTGVTSEDPISSRVGNTASAAQPAAPQPSATAGQGSEGLLSQGTVTSSPELFGRGPAVSTANIFGQSPPSAAPGPSSPELFGSATTANTSDMFDEQQLPSAAQGESSTSFFGQGTTTSQNSLIGPPSLPSTAVDRSATDGFGTDDTADPISSMLCQLQLSSIAQGSNVTGGFGTDTTASQNSLFSQAPVDGAAPGPSSSSIFSSSTTTNLTSMFGQPQLPGAPPSLRTAGGFGQDTITNSGSMFGQAPVLRADTARGASGGIAADNRSDPTGELGWGAGLRDGHHIKHVTNDVHASAQTLPPNDFGGEASVDSLVPVFGSSHVSNDNHPGYFVSNAGAAHGDSGAAVATQLDGTDNDDLANTNDSSDSDGDSDNEHPNGQDAIDLADPTAPQHDGDTVDDLADMLSQVLRTGASDAAIDEQLHSLMSRLEAPSHHEAPPATNPAAPTSPQDHSESDSERDSEGEPISLLRRLQTPGIHRWIRERRRHHGDTPLAVRAMFLVMVKTAMRSARGDAANEELKALSRMSHDDIQRLYAERHTPGL